MMDTDGYAVFIGAVCYDEYYRAKQWPIEGDKEVVSFVGKIPGGMIPNAACVFAGYGNRTYLVDALNDSEDSRALIRDMEKYHVDMTRIIPNHDLPDAKCIIVLTPKERTILVVDSEKPHIDLDPERLELLRGAECVYTSIFEITLFNDPEGLLRDLKAHHTKIVFDVEEASIVDEYRELIKFADIVFFNDSGFRTYSQGNEEAVYDMLFDAGVEIVVVTMAERGSYCRTKDDEDRSPAMQGEIVDTTGAGDTFNSSFVSCILKGMDIHEASRFANTAAGLAIGKMGARGGVQSEEYVMNVMRERGRERGTDT